jgi:hypothetical protein
MGKHLEVATAGLRQLRERSREKAGARIDRRLQYEAVIRDLAEQLRRNIGRKRSGSEQSP